MSAKFGNFITRHYPALGIAVFRRYWFASLASVGGTQLATLGQGWLIWELTESELYLGYLGAAAALPNVAITLFGGVFADRFNRRLIILTASGLTALLLASLTALDYLGIVTVTHILVIAALTSVITGFEWPARVSFYPELVTRDAFTSAVALNSFVWQVTRMAIPAIGGLVIAFVDTWAVFGVGAVGFAVMFMVVARIETKQVKQSTERSPFGQLVEGLSFVGREPLFLGLLVITFAGMFFTMSYIQLMPSFADLLGTDETGFGFLLSAGGVGSVAGTLIVGAMGGLGRDGRVVLGAAAGSALLVFAFALAASAGLFWLAIMLTFAAAIIASVFMIGSMTTMQLRVPDELRGRVMGIHTIGYSLIPAGGLFLGAIADSASTTLAMAIGAACYLLAIVAFGVLNRRVRSMAAVGEPTVA